MHGLLIKKIPLEKILSGKKTWEMRSSSVKRRGTIALIESKSGTIVGSANLVDCRGPLSLAELKQNAKLHQGDAESVDDMFGYAKPHAWVLTNVKRFERPIPYKHPSGAVIWVQLHGLEDAVLRAK